MVPNYKSKQEIWGPVFIPHVPSVLLLVWSTHRQSETLAHWLVPGRLGGTFRKVILQDDLSDWWLRYRLWNCAQINITGPHWWKVNIGSGDGLVPSGIKPLLELMLTQINVAVWRHLVTIPVSDRDAQHRPSSRNATRVKKRGVETIHFAQFLWKIGVEIWHFPHFCLNIRVESIQIFQRPEKGGWNGGAYVVIIFL